MTQITDRFGPIPTQTTLDSAGYGVVTFQPSGKNARITTLFVKATTSVKQAVCTIYKGQISDTNIIGSTNSGSTGAPAFGNIDLFDGETLYVVWTGGDVGATATATFVGQAIPLADIGGSEIRWSDPIAANDGTLVFPAIKSSNFVTGVSGWMLDRNGNAELNNVTVRGDVIVTSTSGSKVTIDADTLYAYTFYKPPTFTNPAVESTVKAASVFAGGTDAGTGSYAFIDMQSPELNSRSRALIQLTSQSYDGAFAANASIFTDDNKDINLDVDGSISIVGFDIGRGRVTGIDTNVSSPAIGNTETVVLTVPSFSYQANRAYRIEFTGLVTASVAGNSPTLRTRKTNTAGQRFTNGTPYCGNTSPTTGDFRSMFTVGAANVTATLVLTLQGSATFNALMFGSATTTTSLDIYDMGLAADHPNIPVLV